MTMIFGIPVQALLGQMLVGLINGSFYAMLSLGLAVIFGLLRIINFAHGALYMFGAFIGYLMLVHLGIGYWPALVLVPLVVGVFGMAVERLALSRLYRLDPLYGLLFTFGLALVIVQRIGELLATLKKRGMTILLVEQNFRFAARIADRFYLMEHGKVVEGFAVSELSAHTEQLHEVLGV